MTKVEKVILALECCGSIMNCEECPYNYKPVGCFTRLKSDALELLKEREWISVKDRLPDSAGYKCLVAAINKFGQKSVFTAFTGYGDFNWYTTDVIYMNKANRNTVSDVWTITHWMPLPEPPKEEEV